jgi:3-dehydroquinate dehydratase / shikimate dehydrogenase
MLFASITAPFEEAKKRLLENENWADGFELRLDTFEKRDLDEIKKLMHMTARPFLFTLRKQSEGGFYKESEEKRKKEIAQLLSLRPHFIDLEWDTEEAIFEICLRHEARVILSIHDFEKMPEDLEALLTKIEREGVYAYKIAVKARSSSDALRMLQFVKTKTSEGMRLSGLCMGEEGKITRILGPVVGNYIDYASADETASVAPGQLCARALCEIYRYKKLNQMTALYALLGDPVDKSASHISHNRVFEKFNLNAVYLKIKVRADELSSFFPLLSGLSFKGFSVTMPLKEKMGPFLSSSEMKAINTLVEKEGEYIGHNTDGKGALDAIEEKEKVKQKRVVILGAGGTGKAIAIEAKRRGAEVILCNRTEEKARELAEELACRVVELSDLSHHGYDMLINTTSVGMAPHDDEMPLSASSLKPGALIMDVVFNPRKTKLLQEAEKKQCLLVYGYEMWVAQAIRQFELWFPEQKFDRNALKKIIAEGYFDYVTA